MRLFHSKRIESKGLWRPTNNTADHQIPVPGPADDHYIHIRNLRSALGHLLPSVSRPNPTEQQRSGILSEDVLSAAGRY